MDYYIDTVSFAYPTPNWANVAPFEPERQERKTLVAQTEFAISKPSSVDFFRVVTGRLAPTSRSVRAEPISGTTTIPNDLAVTPPTVVVSAAANAEVEKIAKQRVQLMAAKYASGTESKEIVARLAILNSRLLDRAPRVSKDQVLALENANEQLARIRAAREERSKRLEISA